ncbi:heavy-metal-associated domain-containing protein [Hydrocarboniphaga effusa]|jgi:copper chaperone CopZ|uniref:heavy-metal-associated domain-containing protein n=1 Tax=Hydrocarboniphaga effusa TaxID=243629 RepID=UPI003137BA3E
MIRFLITAVLSAVLSVAAWANDAPRTVEMKVDGLVCAFCAQGISKKLGKMEATSDVLVNLENGVVAIALKPGKDVNDQDLRDTLTEAGYSLKSIERTSETLEEIRARLRSKP